MLRRIPQKFLPLLLIVPLALMGLASVYFAWRSGPFLDRLFLDLPGLQKPFNAGGLATLTNIVRFAALAGGLVMLGAAIFALLKRNERATGFLRAGYIAVYVVTALYAVAAMMTIGLLRPNDIRVNGEIPDVEALFYIKFRMLWPAVLAALVSWALHILSRKREVRAVFGEPDAILTPTPAFAAAAGGTEASLPGTLDYRSKPLPKFDAGPAFNKSFNVSLVLHVLLIIIFPLIFQGGGCVTDYLIPGGGGGGGGGAAAPALIKVAKVQKQPKKRKFIINPNSSISFVIPDIDDSKIKDEVAKVTEAEYNATGGKRTGKGGAVGKGDGEGGGIGGGSGKGVWRFLRLQHDGLAWDDGMDTGSRADINFLEYLRGPVAKSASAGEAIRISDLKRFSKGKAPPFVYITGNGTIDGITNTDITTLRDYCMTHGGMIFGDAGSPQFGQSFRSLMQRVFPDKPLVDISNDDLIFREPNLFPNGAPSLWHHDGDRAKGVKIDGRWAVFYFPGDLNDAWKTGNSGVASSTADRAFNLGANIVVYAADAYLTKNGQQK